MIPFIKKCIHDISATVALLIIIIIILLLFKKTKQHLNEK